MAKQYLALAAMVALAGCTTPFSAKVSRFQALPVPSGQTFFVQAADPQLQGGLEFNQYAQLIVIQMVRQGYRPAANAAGAELVVKMNYEVDRGRERIVSQPGLGWGGGFGGWGGGFGGWGGGFGGRGFGWGFNDPWMFGGGLGGFGGGFGGFGGGFNDVRSYTIYNSSLNLHIDRTDNGQRVFEGNARAISADDSLPHLVPNLVEAMFTGFPGNSGETVKITIAPPPRR